jgi:hypothetical protein
MERERAKKKPGKAVIISGTSTEPPIHDNPIDISDTSEYVMEYTGMVMWSLYLHKLGLSLTDLMLLLCILRLATFSNIFYNSYRVLQAKKVHITSDFIVQMNLSVFV